MKTFLIASAALLAGATLCPARQTDDELQTETARRAQDSLIVVRNDEVSRVSSGHFTYSGIAVAVVRAENPAQLLNPFAPDEYGRAEDNVVREPITGKATGLKIFSIAF